MLQVCIDRDHCVAVGVLQAREQRGLLAEVSGQLDRAHAQSRVAHRHGQRERVVMASIVNHDDFVGVT